MWASSLHPAAAGLTLLDHQITWHRSSMKMAARGAALELADRPLFPGGRVSGETVCPYCGVGCRLAVEGEVGRYSSELKVRGVADAPANLGLLCAKGALLGDTIA